MDDEECSRLKEELRILTLECENLKSLKRSYDSELIASCLEGEETFESSEMECSSKRCYNVRKQFSNTLDELKISLKRVENDKSDLRHLSDSVFAFCNEEESNLTKLLTNFFNDSTSSLTKSETVREENQTDLDRLRATFEALSRKELEIKLEKCLFENRTNFLCDFEKGLLEENVPEPDCLEKKVAELVTQVEELDKDNKSLLDELKKSIPSLFSKGRLLNVYNVDYENGEHFCRKLDEIQKRCLSELENQNRRFPEFLTLLNGLSKEQADNIKVVNNLERILKERIKTVKRLKKVFDGNKTDQCCSRAEDMANDNCSQKLKEFDTTFNAVSEKFFLKLLSRQNCVLQECGSNCLHKTQKFEEETKDLMEKMQHLELCLAVHVKNCANKK